MKAIINALKLTGFEILEESYYDFIIARKDGTLFVIEDQVCIGEIVEHVDVKHSRFQFESAICCYLANSDEVYDADIKFCVAQLFVLGKDRGMLRHVINWPAQEDIHCDWKIVEVKKED